MNKKKEITDNLIKLANEAREHGDIPTYSIILGVAGVLSHDDEEQFLKEIKPAMYNSLARSKGKQN